MLQILNCSFPRFRSAEISPMLLLYMRLLSWGRREFGRSLKKPPREIGRWKGKRSPHQAHNRGSQLGRLVRNRCGGPWQKIPNNISAARKSGPIERNATQPFSKLVAFFAVPPSPPSRQRAAPYFSWVRFSSSAISRVGINKLPAPFGGPPGFFPAPSFLPEPGSARCAANP